MIVEGRIVLPRERMFLKYEDFSWMYIVYIAE